MPFKRWWHAFFSLFDSVKGRTHCIRNPRKTNRGSTEWWCYGSGTKLECNKTGISADSCSENDGLSSAYLRVDCRPLAINVDFEGTAIQLGCTGKWWDGLIDLSLTIRIRTPHRHSSQVDCTSQALDRWTSALSSFTRRILVCFRFWRTLQWLMSSGTLERVPRQELKLDSPLRSLYCSFRHLLRIVIMLNM